MARRKKVYVYNGKKSKKHAKAFIVMMVVVAVVLAGVATVIAFSNGGTDSGDLVAESLTPSSIMKDWSSNVSSSPDKSEASQPVGGSVDSSSSSVGAAATHDSPVPESGKVDASYFDDALFIGDSRSEGFQLYSELDNATYYVYKGLSVETVNTKAVITAPDGTKQTVMNALKQSSLERCILCLASMSLAGLI